jgi:TonB family protein
MTRDWVQPLSVGRRFLLSMAAVAVVIGPIGVGIMTPIPIRAQPAVPAPSATDVDSSMLSLSAAPTSGPLRVPMPVPVRGESLATRAQVPAPTPSASQERGATKIEIHITVDGRDSAGFVPRDEPYTQGGPSAGVHVPPDSPARVRDGRVISGFEFIGWTEGPRTRVLVLALVPAVGEPNVYTSDAKRLQRVDLASYLVGPELDVTVGAIQGTGFGPVVRLRAVRSTSDSPRAATDAMAPVKSPTTGQVLQQGTGVSAPVPVKTIDPTSTADAMRAGMQGEVAIEGGTPQDIQVLQSLDRMARITGLDQAAIDAAKKWLFDPFGRGAHAHTLNEPGIVPPKATYKIDPTYTSDAMRQKIAGTVKVEAVVLPDGTVGDARIVESLDKTYGLDEAALSAARQWTFDPGTLGARPVAVMVTLTLEFRLH